MKYPIWFFLSCCLFLVGCNRPLQESVLDGYDNGKRTMKYESRIFNEKFDDGTKGYRLENLNQFSIGNMSNRKLTRTTYLNQDFSLRESQAEQVVNENTTRYVSKVVGNQINIQRFENDQKADERNIPLTAPVMSDLHPLLYTQDLKKPGSQKTYRVLDERDLEVKELTVKFVGASGFFENGKSYQGLHYQLQAISDPGAFDDYFIDPKTKSIIKIQFGLIKFIPVD